MISRTTPNLPIELLSLIFEFSYHAAGYRDFTPAHLHSPTLFPFNLALVCRLWRDILAQVPAYWRRLRFDVDNKPILPADAISWTQGRPFEILVQGESPIDIFPITTALLRDFHHCNAVKYDVKYSSSLPHFTQLLVLGDPVLYSIELRCKREDSEKLISALSRNLDPPPLINFYNLNSLVLPCRMFLDTCRVYPCWYEGLRGIDLSLTLSQYCFHSPELEDYTLQELLDHLGAMSQCLYCVLLHDIFLGYQPHSFQARTVESILPDVEMHNVESALINMYFMTDAGPCNRVTFDECSIPRFDVEARLECDYLLLRNIAGRYSLFNIFDAWRPNNGTATMEACPFFDDDLLQWLSKPHFLKADWEPKFCSGRLEELVIIDCPNFTVRALCQMLRARAKAHSHSDITAPVPLKYLRVSGQVPTPSEQDAEWLKSYCWGSVKWEVMGQDGEIKYDIEG